ncbi:CAAX amino terminal protease [Cinnamomum micranthum f. kanehirae]|uniref:CAAX amino terminal protease n=1 Tax=Cinnamomum micranthum f. kanehirae TaxID=337451 RepID=A0A443NLR9_9MAGN|nr:CAAX amino terminal protease [Cinnamomum micranthum f. kanehirae]
MSLRSNSSSHLQLYSLLLPPQNPKFLSTTLQFPHLRFRKLRRLKVSSSPYSFFTDFFSNLPSPNPLDLIAPALGTGAALYLSRLHRRPPDEESLHPPCDVGSWILVSSPTPFNRFVLLRCPSISFEDSDLLEGVNERLLKEDTHFVNLDRGRIPAAACSDGAGLQEKLAYQRVCIGAGDGGVLSLDWPANLELGKERGLDTTVLIVPGTTEGSMESSIQSFVCEALVHGCFPVVMNPRGCAGSPLTTARLFTAADSDDIRTAIQFINKSRPWATLMSIGWGYGANMLTKYLGEVGERTPLTAAVCVDNPFDLKEATRSFPHHIAMDQKLTGGLIDILRTNKELFQGRRKEFKVAEGLSATTLRDFERAISMIPYGFEDIEEFYSKSSTRQLVGRLKIPSDDGTVPLFSIPRSSIAENPFTSLLLCSCSSPSTSAVDGSAILWCQHLAIEWFSAVELALLKGRHPLLKDVDITIKPSKGLALVEGRELGGKVSSGRGILGTDDTTHSYLSYENGDDFFNHTQSDILNGFHADQFKGMLQEIEDEVQNKLNVPEKDFQGRLNVGSVEPHQEKSINGLQQSTSVNADLVNGGGDSPLDDERSQSIQSAEFVMNVFDATVPGTLAEEQKKKVITAMEQGETFVKAMQGAVPDDVRGKLTAAVSEVVRTQEVNLNFVGLKEKIKEKFKGFARANGGHNSTHSSNHMQEGVGTEKKSSEGGISYDSNTWMEDDFTHRSSGDGLSNDEGNSQTDPEKSFMRSGSEVPLKSQKSANSGHSHGDEMITPGTIDSQEKEHAVEKDEALQSKAAHGSSYVESGSGGGTSNHPNSSEKPSRIEEAVGEQHKMNETTDGQAVRKEVISHPKNEGPEATTDQGKPFSELEESSSSGLSSSEPLSVEKEENDVEKNEGKSVQPMRQSPSAKGDEPLPVTVSSSGSPSINMTQALDALTGFDDSTQMAVNSVFGVIENMIDHLEKENPQGNEDNGSKNEDQGSGNASQGPPTSTDMQSGKENGENGSSTQPDVMQSSSYSVNNCLQECTESHQDVEKRSGDEMLNAKLNLLPVNSIGKSQRDNSDRSHIDKEDKSGIRGPTDPVPFMEESKKIKHMRGFPLHISVNPYGDSVYKEYLRKCLLSKIPNTKPLDLDSTTDLFLEFFPEEGEWKLLDQLGNTRESMDDTETRNDVNGKGQDNGSSLVDGGEKIIEPTYVVLDSQLEHESMEKSQKTEPLDGWNKKDESSTAAMEELSLLVKNIVLDALKVEVSRKLGLPDVKAIESNIAYDMEQVADAVAIAIRHNKELCHSLENKDPSKMNFDTLQGEYIMQTISSALLDTSHLRNVVPVGVIVGSILAALRNYFPVATLHGDNLNPLTQNLAGSIRNKFYGHENEVENDNHIVSEKDSYDYLNSSQGRGTGKFEAAMSNNDSVMVGAVTAALGASALLAHHKGKELFSYGNTELPSGAIHVKREQQKGHERLDDEEQEMNQNNIVTSLAEKAMSVAAPVVPTRSDGEVDQERLVAMLADLGQKGGILRLIGKVALLWGGIRGAMSLTDKLISFLHIAERPLFQRILGFAFMVLVLWSPVVVPLIPTLVQNWVAKSSNGIAEYASIIGLYTAVMILVMLWGKRIRGYENPTEQYGLNLASFPKLRNFLKGLTGGIMLVLLIHTMNSLLGCAHFASPLGLPLSQSGIIIWLKALGKMLVLTVQGIMPATGVAIVEELLFRSWLPEEIAVDLGYHRAIIISGLAFSLLQRSLFAIPGLWLLSLALAGAKKRGDGNLSLPIGLRTGILTANFVLQTSGFLTYRSNAPFWLTGIHPWQPFGGIVGLTFCVALAILLYPRQPRQRKKPRVIFD